MTTPPRPKRCQVCDNTKYELRWYALWNDGWMCLSCLDRRINIAMLHLMSEMPKTMKPKPPYCQGCGNQDRPLQWCAIWDIWQCAKCVERKIEMTVGGICGGLLFGQ